jgi:hypothetical protein
MPPDKDKPTTDYAAELVDHLHDIHQYAGQNLKLASDRMKIRYDKLANSAAYQEGVSSIRNLRTRHAVVTRDLPNMEVILYTRRIGNPEDTAMRVH